MTMLIQEVPRLLKGSVQELSMSETSIFYSYPFCIAQQKLAINLSFHYSPEYYT